MATALAGCLAVQSDAVVAAGVCGILGWAGTPESQKRAAPFKRFPANVLSRRGRRRRSAHPAGGVDDTMGDGLGPLPCLVPQRNGLRDAIDEWVRCASVASQHPSGH